MALDYFHLIFVSAALFFGFLSLIVGKSFIRRRDSLHAVDSLWYVTVVLVLCLGFTILANRWHTRELEDQLEELQKKLDKYEDSQ
jgi:hypothetical protein